MKKRNYYDILGVKKSATESEIKSAFRKLARKFHPDINHDPDADDKLAEINNAYEVLMDKDKRAQYDASLFRPFSHFSNFAKNSANNFSTQQGFRWEDLKEKLGENSPFASNSFRFDDLFSAFGYKNKKGQATANNQTQMNSSDGQGGDKQGFFGNVGQSKQNEDLDQHADISVELSSVYTGDTYNIKLKVPVRLATGEVSHEQKQLSFNVPKGITQGKKIRLTGQGAVSLAGSNNGDLLLTVNIKTPAHIRVEGADVYQTINVFPWEAGLGADIRVHTPAGEFAVQIPSASVSGNQLRLKGKGIPAKPAGDLYLLINIVNPASPHMANSKSGFTAEQESAFRNLQEAFAGTEITR